MDNSHCREIHYHLARALMHLNSMRVFSQFLNLQWTGMIIEVDPYTAIPASPVHTRDIFLLLRQFRRYIITWKVFRPTWSSIRSHTYGPCLSVEVHVPLKKIAQSATLSGWTHLFPPVEWECLPLVHQSILLIVKLTSHHLKQNWSVPKPKNGGPKMLVQRKNNVPWVQHRTPRRPPPLRPYQSSATFFRRAHRPTIRWGHLPRTFSVKSSPGFSVIGEP